MFSSPSLRPVSVVLSNQDWTNVGKINARFQSLWSRIHMGFISATLNGVVYFKSAYCACAVPGMPGNHDLVTSHEIPHPPIL